MKDCLKNPKSAYYHAYKIGRFLEGEKLISKSAQYSYYYARDVLKGRFELGEETISKDGEYSYLYAVDILKSRFELGEEIISKNAQYCKHYQQKILHCSFTDLERKDIVVRNTVNGILELQIKEDEDKKHKNSCKNENIFAVQEKGSVS